jgi:hypothetical protein
MRNLHEILSEYLKEDDATAPKMMPMLTTMEVRNAGWI